MKNMFDSNGLKFTKRDRMEKFSEGCKCCVYALVNWLLMEPKSAWQELELAKQHFISIKEEKKSG